MKAGMRDGLHGSVERDQDVVPEKCWMPSGPICHRSEVDALSDLVIMPWVSVFSC
jgi:hypothetical protein